MQTRGQPAAPSKTTPRMRVTDDEIREKYLERAIRELNRLNGELAECELCDRGGRIPVLGSGHPQADVFMLKYSPRPSEVEEGVAFYGRSGQALIKSLGRLSIDPLTVYGTLCIKCPVTDSIQSSADCRARVLEELAVVDPRIVVVMGEAALVELNALEVPLGRDIEARPGEVQRLTPSCEALWVPDIDASLDEEGAKRDFWSAFRALGAWYEELPPY